MSGTPSAKVLAFNENKHGEGCLEPKICEGCGGFMRVENFKTPYYFIRGVTCGTACAQFVKSKPRVVKGKCTKVVRTIGEDWAKRSATEKLMQDAICAKL